VTLALLAGAPAAEEPTVEPDKVAVFMRAKLSHAQNVLEGLAVEDFDLIDRGANDLALASQASSWQVLQTADYARHSDEFRRSCNALRAAAKARNLDGAALAWMEVTMKCIQCHKYVRDTERGR
jgi:cytochrome c556